MGAHILVIDDDPSSLEFLRYMLSSAGHDVAAVAGGAAGLRAARKRRPDLIVSDAEMPEMSGCELAKRLKSDPALRAIPLVVVTASTTPADRERMLSAGFDGFVAKPVAPETVVTQIEAFLPRAAASAASSAANREHFLAEMAARFAESFPKDLEALRVLAGAGDLLGLWKSTHKVLGTCIFLREPRLVRALRKLEKLAGDGDSPEIEGALREVEEAAALDRFSA
jgi:CheY-like chemotaxis protein